MHNREEVNTPVLPPSALQFIYIRKSSLIGVGLWLRVTASWAGRSHPLDICRPCNPAASSSSHACSS